MAGTFANIGDGHTDRKVFDVVLEDTKLSAIFDIFGDSNRNSHGKLRSQEEDVVELHVQNARRWSVS